MRTHTTYLHVNENRKYIPITPPGLVVMVNTHQLELPLSRTYFHGSKGV